MNRPDAAGQQARAEELVERLCGRPLVLIGMMGAGKTTAGRRLSNTLGRQFLDSDDEIEKAAQMTISEIFKQRGEHEFRAGETRVIARVLKNSNIVLATGGGAFANLEIRTLVRQQAISVWLKADAAILFDRVSRRSNRPLLRTANPRATLEKLIEERYPIYATADVTVLSRNVAPDVVAHDIIDALLVFLKRQDV